MAVAAFRHTDEGLEVRLHVQPKASRSEFTGWHGDRLKARVRAKPVDGAANAAVIELLAKTAGVAKSTVSIKRGKSSREKDLRIVCDASRAVEERIRKAIGSPEPS